MSSYIVIPARYSSSRLPGKPLCDIKGIPMIIHVAQRAKKVSGVKEVFVATDDSRIMDVVNKFGFKCVMTRKDHISGTDRIYEAVTKIGLLPDDIIINVQGDQPLLDITAVEKMFSLYKKGIFSMTTVACKMSKKEAQNPNRVKVVVDNSSRAIYFSRSQIPFDRDGLLDNVQKPYLRHLGLYCYNVLFLKKFVSWPEGKLEKIERLEQLRVIENGCTIGIATVNSAPPEVDTEEDLALVRSLF